MAQNYEELKTQLQLLIDRDDAREQESPVGGTDVDVLDDFIRKAEQRFYRSEAARIPPMEKFVDYTLQPNTGVTAIDIPTDYFETRYITATIPTGRQFNLTKTSPEQINNTLTSLSVSVPREFAYGNNQWIMHAPNQQIQLRANYYGFLDALSSQTGTTNRHWLLNNGDDLIIYWAAVDAALYFGGIDPTMMEQWNNRATIIHNQIVEQEVRQQDSGSTPKVNRPYRSSRARRYGFPFYS